jgi:hypothetical protein
VYVALNEGLKLLVYVVLNEGLKLLVYVALNEADTQAALQRRALSY